MESRVQMGVMSIRIPHGCSWGGAACREGSREDVFSEEFYDSRSYAQSFSPF